MYHSYLLKHVLAAHTTPLPALLCCPTAQISSGYGMPTQLARSVLRVSAHLTCKNIPKHLHRLAHVRLLAIGSRERLLGQALRTEREQRRDPERAGEFAAHGPT